MLNNQNINWHASLSNLCRSTIIVVLPSFRFASIQVRDLVMLHRVVHRGQAVHCRQQLHRRRALSIGAQRRHASPDRPALPVPA